MSRVCVLIPETAIVKGKRNTSDGVEAESEMGCTKDCVHHGQIWIWVVESVMPSRKGCGHADEVLENGSGNEKERMSRSACS